VQRTELHPLAVDLRNLIGTRLRMGRAASAAVVVGIGGSGRGSGWRIRQDYGRSVGVTRIVVGKGERGDEAQQRTRDKNKKAQTHVKKGSRRERWE
jgi:hypothetical protein